MIITKKSNLKDAIYGLAVADAIGVPVEFKDRGSFFIDDMMGYGTHNQPSGTWSDDTSMTIATCDAIRKKGYVEIEEIRTAFKEWLFEGKYTPDGRVFDCGNTTFNALKSGNGCDDEYSNGNGSLMRIIPLAFIQISNKDIGNVSSITHAHSISKKACVIYVNIAKRLLNGESIRNILMSLNEKKPFERLTKLENIAECEIRSSGYVVDTLEAALWCLVTTTNYKDCVLKAVNLGSDTDTVAAVAGGLAGIVYGVDGIPAKWMQELRAKHIIESCLF